MHYSTMMPAVYTVRSGTIVYVEQSGCELRLHVASLFLGIDVISGFIISTRQRDSELLSR
jgi:hypothetical protein